MSIGENGTGRPDTNPNDDAAKKRESDGRIPSGGDSHGGSPAPEDSGGTRYIPPESDGKQAAGDGMKPPGTPHPDPLSTQLTPPESDKTDVVQPLQSPPKDAVPPQGQVSGTPAEPDNELAMLQKALAGRYTITKKLGEGGMASVYHAREIALEREVAIKVLPQSYIRDKQFVARFKREAQVAANLEHPHIVRIYQIGESENLVYFVMSYIPGGSLSDQIKKRGPLPSDDIVQWGMDTCSALGYAHDHGVIHRDLKPDNIMLDTHKRAVVMDFGIARAGHGSGLTQTGAVIGTPQFMSPEQARGLDLDSRSDIYSMGLVLYQMATATLPFKADDPASLMYMHVHEAPEPPDVRNDKVPAWLRDIILKCLAKSPDDRFATARELRLALAEHKAPELTEKTFVQKREAPKKTGAGVWIAAAVVVVAVAAAGWFFFAGREKTPVRQAAPPAVAPAKTPQEQPEQAPAQQVSADDLAFQQAEMINTKQAYTTYLEKYPEGAHIDDAKAKLSAIEDVEKLAASQKDEQDTQRRAEQQRIADERRKEEEAKKTEAARADNEAFAAAKTSGTAQAFTTYLQSYPLGAHTDEARARIAELNKQTAEADKTRAQEQVKRDDEAFTTASNSNTKESYSTYLIAFPTGRHADEAKKRVAAIDERRAFEEKLGVALSALSIKMVQAPGGTFQMGSNDADDEKPTRMITLTGFSISTTEITQGQFKAIMNDNPSFQKLDDNLPVERVTWKEAADFCNRLSEKMGLQPCYVLSSGACDMSKNGFRLPTEAEWEYACRAGSGNEYNTGSGESALTRAGWYQSNSGEKTHPVGQKTANAWGVYDMHGNVWEWTNDFYSKRSYELDKTTKDPTGVEGGKTRVLRGGSWLDNPKDCRASKRREYDPEKRYSDIGFRIVRR